MTLRRQTAPLPPIAQPSITETLATELGINTSDAIANLIETSLLEAIQHLPNPRHALIFATYHGIRPSGERCTPATYEEIASHLGCSRERVSIMYYRAAAQVYEKLSRDLAIALQQVTA